MPNSVLILLKRIPRMLNHRLYRVNFVCDVTEYGKYIVKKCVIIKRKGRKNN